MRQFTKDLVGRENAMHLTDCFNSKGQADSRKVALILRTSIAELTVAAGVDLQELPGP